MGNLRLCFRGYYESEGKDSEFEVYFIAEKGNYLLGVKRRIKEHTSSDSFSIAESIKPRGDVHDRDAFNIGHNNEPDRVRKSFDELTAEGDKLLAGPYADDVLEDTIQKFINIAYNRVIYEYECGDSDPYCLVPDIAEGCFRLEIQDAITSYRTGSSYIQKITEWIKYCRKELIIANFDTFFADFNRELGDTKFPEEDQLACLVGIISSAKKFTQQFTTSFHPEKIFSTFQELTVEGEALVVGPDADDVLENSIHEFITRAVNGLPETCELEHFITVYPRKEVECYRPEIEATVLSNRERSSYTLKITEWIICCREVLKIAHFDHFSDDFNRRLGDTKFPEGLQLAPLVGIISSAKKLTQQFTGFRPDLGHKK